MSPTSQLQPVNVLLLRGYGFIAFTKAAESETEPKTPPCILIILIAAWWFPKSVAPQQSDSSKHSKPRSFASHRGVHANVGRDTGEHEILNARAAKY